MKKTLIRIISLMLIVASLISAFSIFAFAADGDTAADEPEAPVFNETEHLLYNRTFDDGWSAFAGVPTDNRAISEHKLTIDYEESNDYSYNYFMRFEYGKTNADGYVIYDFGNRVIKEGYTIIGMSLKADDACELGTILKFKSGGDEIKDLLCISNSSLYAFAPTPKTYICALDDNDWYDFDIVIDWNDMSKFKATVVMDGETVVEYESTWSSNKDAGIKSLYLGAPGVAKYNEKVGMSYCVDNLRMYQYQPKPIDLSGYGYGIFVDTEEEKTETILESSKEMTAERALKESLAMKLGVSSALANDVKIGIEDDYFIPTVINGNTMISLELVLDFLGYPYYKHSEGASYDITIAAGTNTYLTVGRQTATVAGELVDLSVIPAVAENTKGKEVVVISIDDVAKLFPEWLVAYDDMGLIIVYKNFAKEGEDASNLINRRDNLETMLDMMKKFVFDTVATDEDGNALANDAVYSETGKAIYTAASASGLAHPYIYTNQAGFDAIAQAYASSADVTLKGYIQTELDKANAYYNEVVESIDANGTVTFKAGKKPVNVFQDSEWPTDENPNVVADTDDGYNGKTHALYEVEEFSAHLVELAFAYQVTGDVKYVQLAYAVSLVLGEWIHWGPGYFINCATAVNNFAVSYDWLYNAYVDEFGEDSVEELAAIIYNQGLFHGYNSVTGEFCKFSRTEGYGDKYTNRTDSWNAIGTSGMVIGALAIMGSDVYTENSAKIEYVIGASLVNLINYGLDRYAPDGAYIDSVTSWAQSTNAFMKLVMALKSTTGDDFGFKDTWGINTTFYYASYISNSNGEAWNYHEDGIGSILSAGVLYADTQMLNFAAQLLSDPNLLALRKNQLAQGKESTLFDILFYSAEVVEMPELELDYFLEGADAFVSRSDWEKDALFVGLMGGANQFKTYGDGEGEEVFGQLDSGNFIYENKGVKFIVDLGSDNFYAYTYFGDYRYRYYRNTAEGNNVVLMTSKQAVVEYGQAVAADGDMYDTYVDPNGKGSYAIINNANAYDTYARAAYRGMAVLNDRKTVVIQDEIALVKSEDLVWVAHTAAGTDNIALEDGNHRVAYITQKDSEGNDVHLRMTIVSNASYEFEVIDSTATTFVKKTLAYDPAAQFDRSNYTRLVIKADQTLNFNVAVVLEVVDSLLTDQEVGYEYMGMNKWPTLFEEKDDGAGADNIRGTAVRKDIEDRTTDASLFIEDESAFTYDFEEFYICLTTVRYTLATFPAKDFGALDFSLRQAHEDWQEYVEVYGEYRTYVNDAVEDVKGIVDILTGV